MSCAATYNNQHKTIGSRRSKLEFWLEEKLKSSYPQLNLIFNEKHMIGSELDIFIPELCLAFELNGIFHYKPIYGEEKLSQIQNNDLAKAKACCNIGINLHVIDTSSQNRFKQSTSDEYLTIIKKAINEATASFIAQT
jgi:hypothetical protein